MAGACCAKKRSAVSESVWSTGHAFGSADPA